MDSAISTIHQCMQRGERPLSIIDLIEKEFLTINQAAWLISHIMEGSSWLVGAVPSHAGKTTMMSALLVFLEAEEQVELARAGLAWESFGANDCVVSEEISDHRPGVYLWGGDVRGVTAIPARGGRIASTIHANSLEQAREQISRQCEAGEQGLAAFGIFVPIEIEYSPDLFEESLPGGRRRRLITSRRVESIYHFEAGSWSTIDREVKLTEPQHAIAIFLNSCQKSGIYTCEALREAWLEQKELRCQRLKRLTNP